MVISGKGKCQCSYLLVGSMEFRMSPQRVQKDRSSFAGLVGGIAEKRERPVGQRERGALAIPFTSLKWLQQLPLVTRR